MSDFLHEATERGFVAQCTDADGLRARMASGAISGYIGFDCTADSLHVGSLMQIMLLRMFKKHGHNPIILLGGGTTLIGDPSGKDTSRKMLTSDEIEVNTLGIAKCFTPFIDLPVMINNLEWLKEINFLTMLREVGPHFTINRMLAFDSVQRRLDREEPLTFLEFNYMILQSFDFRELSRRFGVSLQMGGSDQWGNIVSGIDLIRRTDQRAAFGLTTPLLQTSSGKKMGKTESGTIWLDPAKTPRFDFFQFWRNVEDDDVAKFLALFTDVSMNEINRIKVIKGKELNDAKELLASSITNMVHGSDKDAASVIKFRSDGMRLAEILRDVGLAASISDAKRLISGGGVSMNNIRIIDAEMFVDPEIILSGFDVNIGKKKKRFIKGEV